MSEVFVKRLQDKGDVRRAQIFVGQKAGPGVPVSEFSAEMQERLNSINIGERVVCVTMADATPATVRPLPAAAAVAPPVAKARPRDAAPAGSARRPDNLESRVVVGYDRTSKTVRFENGSSISATALPFSDPVLTLRPGARLTKNGAVWTVNFAPDVQEGLGTAPDVDRNPYSFAGWEGGTPTPLEDPSHATHEREHANRSSGRIDVTFTAGSPVFVPEGRLQHEDQTAPFAFFHCWDGEQQRYAIPGSSMKGAIRSLFEALTNSRMGVTDANALERAPLYRRRSAVLYRVVALPSGAMPGKVVRCDFEFRDERGNPVEVQGRRPPAGAVFTNEDEWRANLFWVTPDKYRHGRGKCRIAWAATTSTLDLPQNVLDAYLRMKDHPHFLDHPANVASNRALSRYASPGPENWHAPAYDQCEADLFSIKEGELLFGIRDGAALACFGKNVNFLWPGQKSPLALLGSFRARAEKEKMTIESADAAEAAFGFAAEHKKDMSHPFRGRIRFGPFWGPPVTDPLPPAIELMPLTSPAGTKLKARPLYLEGQNGKSGNYDGNAKLRGRKFYWHQKTADGTVPKQHRHDLLTQGQTADVPLKMRPAPIRPLPVGTTFTGVVAFDNLTDAELGALIACLSPGLAFGEEPSSFGIKIGKGKPRGLGTIVCSAIQVKRLRKDRYESWNAAQFEALEPAPLIDAYKTWISGHLRRRWDDLAHVQDLRRLLRIPSKPSARMYPPTFGMYGWGPQWDDPVGNPPGGVQGRPPGMSLARDDRAIKD